MLFRGGLFRRIHKITEKGLPAAPIGNFGFLPKTLRPLKSRRTVEIPNLGASFPWRRIPSIPCYLNFSVYFCQRYGRQLFAIICGALRWPLNFKGSPVSPYAKLCYARWGTPGEFPHKSRIFTRRQYFRRPKNEQAGPKSYLLLPFPPFVLPPSSPLGNDGG